jgi:hypothetical protein
MIWRNFLNYGWKIRSSGWMSYPMNDYRKIHSNGWTNFRTIG